MTDSFIERAFQDVQTIYHGESTLIRRARFGRARTPVIIKSLRSDLPSFREISQLKHEYRILSFLKGTKGVIDVLDFMENKNDYLLILEDMGGQSLKSLLGKNRSVIRKKQDLKKFLLSAITMCEIIGAVHAKEIIHKDINTANFVINPETDTIKLIDFNISTKLTREIQQIKNPEKLEGTLEFISPEQSGRMNRSVDYRSDLYSLGVVFYTMLSGTLPFQSADPMELIHCHIAHVPEPLHLMNPTVPETLSLIVGKLLSKPAEDRYQSVYGLIHDLETCLQQLDLNQSITTFEPGQYDVMDRFEIPEKLYGRQVETERLMNSFAQVSCGEINHMVVLVSGYSGIGKSALINEIHKPLVQERGYFTSGKFNQLNRDMPYSALIEALSGLIRQILTESQARIDMWRALILDAVGTNGQIVTDVIPELELIVGEQAPVPSLPPNESQNRFNAIFADFIHVFAKKEHPLVIFIDDLHWGDLASLNLIKFMLGRETYDYFFLIGAYRDNEVSPSHPLLIAIDDIERQGTPVRNIVLSPLTKDHVRKLTMDTFHCNKETAIPLVDLLVNKTNGNPFFTIQFLKMLYYDKWINFNSDDVKWTWDIAKIRQLDVTDNVVDLLTKKISTYPDDVQRSLTFAASIGNRFDLKTLSIAMEEPRKKITENLRIPIKDGLISPTSDNYTLVEGFTEEAHFDSFKNEKFTYKFQHDRIQQAAYSLIPDEEKKAIHLHIGNHLLMNIRSEERDEKLFEIVTHLNQGSDLLTDETDKLTLAELNLSAGIKAKNANASAVSGQCLAQGVRLLPDDAWQQHYALTFELHKHKAQASFLNGHFNRSQKDFRALLTHAAHRYDKADIYLIMMTQYAQLGDYKQSFDTGVECLALLDYVLPDISTPEKIDQSIEVSLATFKALLGKRTLSQLKDLPDIADKDKSYLIIILCHICDAAYIALPPVFPHVIFDIVNFSIEFGYNHYSAVGFCWLPVLLSLHLKDYDMAYESGQLSLALNERYNNAQLKSLTVFLTTTFTTHWKFHFKQAIRAYSQAFALGVQNGENTYSGYAMVMIPKAYLAIGSHVDLVREKTMQSIDFLTKTNSIFAEDGLFFREFLNNLTRVGKFKTNFDCPDFTEDEYLAKWQSVSFGHGLGYYLWYKTQILYLFEYVEEAYDIGCAHRDWARYIATLYEETHFLFFHTLSAIAHYLQCDEKKKKKAWATIRENDENFALWALQCPDNFEHKHFLIKAEIARIEGKNEEAVAFYDKALDSAQHYKCVNIEALINELTAKYYFSVHNDRMAKMYLKEAHYTYTMLGLAAKAGHMEKTYPEFLKGYAPKESLSSTFSIQVGTAALDYKSIIKATQAISGEMNLGKLLEKLMHLIVENAGAQRGFILLNNNGNLVIDVIASMDPFKISVVDSLPFAGRDDLCETMVAYSSRTKETLIINDAANEGAFTEDDYIRQNKPKSILCKPIINQGRLIGLLYLENNVSTGAFTRKHIEGLEVLASQAAVSIENAGLYAHLEDKVRERTKELKETNNELLRVNEVLAKTRDALWGEMELAKKIQTSLIPTTPRIEGFDIAGYMKPAKEVGGDYYDVITIGHQSWIVIGDVSGHGVTAGLIMMMVQTAIHTVLNRFPALKPSELLGTVNTAIRENMLKLGEDKYITIMVMALVSHNTLEYSGLHQDLIIYRAASRTVDIIETNGMWLGVVDDLEALSENSTLKLHKGDVLALFSDGITESYRKDHGRHTMFGQVGIEQVLEKNGEKSVHDICRAILAKAENYESVDDITLLILKKKT